MSEEIVKQEEPVVEVSQEVVEKVNEEVEAEKKEAVQEVVDNTNKSLDDLKKELEETRVATQKISEEQERQRLEQELAVEKAKLVESQKPKRKAVVVPEANPVSNPEPEVANQEVNIPIAQQWGEFDALARVGAFNARANMKK